VEIFSEEMAWTLRSFRRSSNARSPGKRRPWNPRGGWVRWVALVGCAQGKQPRYPTEVERSGEMGRGRSMRAVEYPPIQSVVKGEKRSEIGVIYRV